MNARNLVALAFGSILLAGTIFGCQTQPFADGKLPDKLIGMGWEGMVDDPTCQAIWNRLSVAFYRAKVSNGPIDDVRRLALELDSTCDIRVW